MILTFNPGEGEARSWPVQLDKIMQPEAELIERRTGMTWDEFGGKLAQGSALARRALVYVLEKRTHPTLAWESFGADFPVGAISLEYDRDEMAQIIAGMDEAMPDGAEKDAALAQLRALAEDAPEAPKAVPSSGPGEPDSVTLLPSSD